MARCYLGPALARERCRGLPMAIWRGVVKPARERGAVVCEDADLRAPAARRRAGSWMSLAVP